MKERGRHMPIQKGDFVTILPEFQDPGDAEFTWQAVTDEEKGRVTLQVLGTGMHIAPTYVMKTEWIQVTSTSLNQP
jgi:hypothetical protein